MSFITTNGPARIYYYENGNKEYEFYSLNGKYHNENGPAVIVYDENGNKKHESYYYNNERIEVNSLEEF